MSSGSYDPVADALHMNITDDEHFSSKYRGTITTTFELHFMLDLDEHRNVIGFEMLDVSKQLRAAVKAHSIEQDGP